MALAKTEANDSLMRIGEISEQEKIPKKFLEVILLELRKHGILGSKLGVHGGYYLLKKPKQIILSDIIRLTDGPIAMIPCVSLKFYEKCEDCSDEVTCGLRKVMIQLRDAGLSILSNTSIADVIAKEKSSVKSKKRN
jgi:Rrf2 family protein